MKICLIPARGGSKRIPRKNIKMFRGRPMIAWSIEAAKKSQCFDQIVVSTDDTEIADIACTFGATSPFIRPEHLSGDFVSTQSVIHHALDWFSSSNIDCSALCCLYATAPFVTSNDLEQGCKILSESNDDVVVFSATTYPFPIQRAIRIASNGYSSMFDPSQFLTRSQDLEEAFHDAGQFYWATPSTWYTKTNLFQYSKPLLLPRWRVQDIDTPEDWVRAELMHQLITQLS